MVQTAKDLLSVIYTRQRTSLNFFTDSNVGSTVPLSLFDSPVLLVIGAVLGLCAYREHATSLAHKCHRWPGCVPGTDLAHGGAFTFLSHPIVEMTFNASIWINIQALELVNYLMNTTLWVGCLYACVHLKEMRIKAVAQSNQEHKVVFDSNQIKRICC